MTLLPTSVKPESRTFASPPPPRGVSKEATDG